MRCVLECVEIAISELMRGSTAPDFCKAYFQSLPSRTLPIWPIISRRPESWLEIALAFDDRAAANRERRRIDVADDERVIFENHMFGSRNFAFEDAIDD